MQVGGQVMDWDSIRFPSHPMTPHTQGHVLRIGDPGTSQYSRHDSQKSSVHQSFNSFQSSRGADFTVPPSVGLTNGSKANVPDDSEQKFRRSYTDLAQQIAYRYPNPGMPKAREGAIGGTWRHVKEVLGHGGSMVCFIDGLVRVYDQEKFTEALQPTSPAQPVHVTPSSLAPAPFNYGYSPTQSDKQLNYGYSPTQRVKPPLLDEAIERKLMMSSTPKRKGHYRY
ncbi:unnamed protein product [Lymnaea stagnalis]|uniref:Uncharacterized protein n=1 Tax=Lymnaea stagnalis TaxID=6523 RepID=A0AAV2I3F9_LYMST